MFSSRSLTSGWRIGIVVDAGGPAVAPHREIAASAAARSGDRLRRRLILILEAFGVRTAVAFQLRLNPVDRRTVAISTLPTVTELRQALDGGFIFLEIESVHERLHRIVRRCGGRLCRRCRLLRKRGNGQQYRVNDRHVVGCDASAV